MIKIRLKNDKRRHSKKITQKIDFGTSLGSQNGSQNRSKRDPKGIKKVNEKMMPRASADLTAKEP